MKSVNQGFFSVLGLVGVAVLFVGCSRATTRFSEYPSKLTAARVGDGVLGELDASKVPHSSGDTTEDATAGTTEDATAGTTEDATAGTTAGSTSGATADTVIGTTSGTTVDTNDGATAGTRDGAGHGGPIGAATGDGSPVASAQTQASSPETPKVCKVGEEAVGCGAEDQAVIKACIDEFKIGAAKNPTYRYENRSGKNLNNRTIFADPASEKSEIVLVKIVAKNVNHSRIDLLNPKSFYCVDMRVKNMNQFRFRISCEAHVGFAIVSKNANKTSVNVERATCE